MSRDDDIFTVTQQLASLLNWLSVPLLVISVPGLMFGLISIINDGTVLRPILVGTGVMWLIFIVAIAQLLTAAKVIALRRWAMHVAMTLAGCWAAIATAICVLALSTERGLVILGGLIAWPSISCIVLTRRCLKALNEDDGWSTDEPARPKGFEPVLPAVTSPTPLPARDLPDRPARADS